MATLSIIFPGIGGKAEDRINGLLVGRFNALMPPYAPKTDTKSPSEAEGVLVSGVNKGMDPRPVPAVLLREVGVAPT